MISKKGNRAIICQKSATIPRLIHKNVLEEGGKYYTKDIPKENLQVTLLQIKASIIPFLSCICINT